MNAWWHEVWETLQAEFADVGDASQLTRITVRLLMAAILGGILGFEREHKGKAAGYARTCWWRLGRRCLYWCRRRPARNPTR
jgi:hypothetical protein